MPKLDLIQTNFTAGEVSPKCFGRVDVVRYQNGAESLENCIVDIQGGANRRMGTLMVQPTRHHDRRSILVPFVFSVTQAYMLELGHQYMRVYVASGGQVQVGGVPYEIATPWTDEMLSALDFTQGADTMFIFHGDVPTQVLRRLAADVWSLRPAPWIVEPFDEIGDRFGAVLTASDTSAGTGRTFTTSKSVFMPADVGRRIQGEGAGLATITHFVSETTVTGDIDEPFISAVQAPNRWVLDGSPQSNLTPSAEKPVGAAITLSFDRTSVVVPGPWKEITQLRSETAIFVTDAFATVPGHGFVDGSTVEVTGCIPEIFNGSRAIRVINADMFSYSLPAQGGVVSQLGEARGMLSKLAGETDGWRARDVGKFVEINGGLAHITAIESANVAHAVIKRELTAAVTAPPNSWALESSMWSDDDGYPQTGWFYEQRLVVGGSRRFPQSLWGSRTALYYDFTQGVDDDEGFNFELPSTGQINPIRHLHATGALIPLTYGAEFTLHGGVEKPLTPTNVQMKARKVFGCNSVRPVRIGDEVVFVQRAGRKIRAISYDPDTYSFSAPDLTVVADHITRSGIVSMAYQQEPSTPDVELQDPSSVLWCVRADGKLAVLTLDRDEGVAAWAPQVTDGAFEWVATVPRPDGGDEVWAVVRRTIGGKLRRYVERFDDSVLSDCAVIGTSDAGRSTWGGLSHLEGKTVWCKGDSVYLGTFTVERGEITLPRSANAVEIGLPYTNKVKPLRPEVAMATGTVQASKMSDNQILPLFRDTTGCKIETANGEIEEIPFRTFGSDLLDRPPEIRTGYESVGTIGWQDSKAPITLFQDMPFPFHLLAIVRQITFNS